MALLDKQGRVFGKVSLLDVGAGLVILLVIFSIFFLPGSSGSLAQMGAKAKPIEIDVLARNVGSSDPLQLVNTIKQSGKANIVVRNQPAGQLEIKNVIVLPRTFPVPQPDGSVKALPDPRPELSYTSDLLLTLAGQAQVSEGGPVIGQSKVKIAIPLEIEGKTFNFSGGIVDVRLKE